MGCRARSAGCVFELTQHIDADTGLHNERTGSDHGDDPGHDTDGDHHCLFDSSSADDRGTGGPVGSDSGGDRQQAFSGRRR